MRSAALITILLLAACGDRVPTAAPIVSPAPAEAPLDAPAPTHDAGAAGSASQGLITDDECVARGGRVVTEETYAHLSRRPPRHPVTPFRVCRIPSPKNGATCRNESDCAGGRCMCIGPLARPDPASDPTLLPLDGSVGTGACSDEPLPSGSWYCRVQGGKVRFHGIIID